MVTLTSEELDLIYQKALEKKLGNLAHWDKPEIGYCVGPDGRERFDAFEKRLDSLKTELLAFLKVQDHTWLSGFLYNPNPMRELHETKTWTEFQVDKVKKLRRAAPPAIAAGFGHPSFLADFEYWGQMPSFNLHEALMLSLGVEPENVSESLIEELSKERDQATIWPAWKYLLRRQRQFRRFFPHTGFGFANMSIARLKRRFDQMDLDVHPEFYAQLERRVSTEESEAVSNDKPLKAQERRTLLKLVAAMACEQYGFDPRVEKSEATARIRDDVELIGETMDAKTIRKWLHEAASFVKDDYWKA